MSTRSKFYAIGLPSIAALFATEDLFLGFAPRICVIGPTKEEIEEHAPVLLSLKCLNRRVRTHTFQSG